MTNIGGKYAQALYDLAAEEGQEERILDELQTLAAGIAPEDGFLRVLSAHNISKEERCAILERCFGGQVHPYVMNLMKLMTEKGCIRQFLACCEAYRSIYNDRHGILQVRAASAAELTQAQKERLCEKIEKLTGKHVALQTVIDPACLGGLRLDYDGKRFDDTIRHRLDDVRGILENTML